MDASLAEHSINPEREAVNMDDKLRAATPTSVIMQSEEQQERVDHELKENGVGVLDVKEKDDTSDVKDSVDAQHNKDEVPGEVGPTIELSKQGYDSEVIEGDDRPPDHTESSPPPATRQDPVSRESPHLHSSEQTRSLQLSDCVTIDPVSINVYAYVRIYVCMYVFSCVYTYVRIHRMYVHKCIRTYVHMHIRTYVRTYLFNFRAAFCICCCRNRDFSAANPKSYSK